MIPQVVASEKGRAQTRVACCTGVVGLHLESTHQIEASGKLGHSR